MVYYNTLQKKNTIYISGINYYINNYINYINFENYST